MRECKLQLRAGACADCVRRYASVAVVWIDYVCKYMNSKEVNMLLKDFLRHVSPNRAYVHLFQFVAFLKLSRVECD